MGQTETKQIFRIFQQLDTIADSWNYKGNRYRPEFRLFSQELIPGVTLNGKFTIEKSINLLDPIKEDDSDRTVGEETSDVSKKRLNSNVLLIPGVWWSFLNPFQLNLGYSFSKSDSTFDSVATESIYKDGFGHTFSINPRLDFAQNVHISNRTEISQQNEFDVRANDGLKVLNEAEIISQDRKTKFLIEYDININNIFELDFSDEPIKDTLNAKSYQHDVRLKWTERWQPLLRTELRTNIGWQKSDTTLLDISGRDSIITNDYKNVLSPGVLIDWRIQKEILREFRLQYFTGVSFYDGTFLNFPSYKTSWDNKVDLSVKVGRNFILRLLTNLNYLFDEEMLRYDLTEFKATALF